MSNVRTQSADAVTIHGTVAPGFDPVREVFAENFRDRNELGAAVAVYSRGEPVVDLWGGYRDTDRLGSWEADTMVLVASGTKGMTAAAIAVALSQGVLALLVMVATGLRNISSVSVTTLLTVIEKSVAFRS